ncbi:MAG: hypothetical protein SF123_22320 [Chloroflexota bacterium]|nr:hypothetical protein [Chloroflexota bacterium]
MFRLIPLFWIVLLLVSPASAQPPLPAARIVYLADAVAIPATSFRQPEVIVRATGAHIVSTWDEVLGLHKQAPLQALIIDRSAIWRADWAWVRAAYRSSVVIVMFNLYSRDVSRLLANPCIYSPGFADEEYTVDFFVMVAQMASTHNPADLEQWMAHKGCDTPAVNITGPAHFGAPKSQNHLTSSFDLHVFQMVLQGNIQDVVEFYAKFGGI